MTVSDLTLVGRGFQAAVEACDFPRAETELQKYLAAFTSQPRSLVEVESARELFEWGAQTTESNKRAMAEDLMILRRVLKDYVPPRPRQTWCVDG